ncbi:MAG: ATP-dependent DNA helicase RecG [Candidatus Levybacteria bacterium]|nr:ATP-dependent DNA helicase RecG [Candidatus Levybacteria bacterium]
MNLQTPIPKGGSNFKLYARRLERLGVKIFEDLLYHIPSRYEDYSLISKIGQVQAGETVTVRGTVLEIKNEYTRGFKNLQKAKLSDDTGEINIVWFNQPYLVRIIHANDNISISGKVNWFSNKLVLQSPEYELANESFSLHTGRLVPIYPETKGVSSKWLRRQIYNVLKDSRQNLTEYLPDSIINNYDLLGVNEAIEQIHFPKTLENAEKAKKRLAFDEFFLMHLSSIQRRSTWRKTLVSNPYSISNYKKEIEDFWKKLPFTLTNAQKRGVGEIFKDLAGKKPMNRLLEGDVGSGKTVVSAIAMFLNFLNGYQSVFMAPTEILAIQHYNTISKLLSPFGIKVQLFTSSSNFKKNKDLRLKIKESDHKSSIVNHKSPTNFGVAVGTHALLYEKIEFEKLGLVVIDEQQRFGVEQRAIIRRKGKNPHLLTMTATPIPRTIALTLYGDLDLSLLDEMPKGRKYIKTWLVGREKRISAYRWIEKQIKETNSQVFIICPFIEESETMQTVKAASREYEYLKKDVFKKFKLGLLHGKLKTRDKDKVLQDFRDKKIDILVATPVVEVGIDIPNATIIVIEASERFGLAQLHQLRGRVGRGNKQSYCLLFTESKNQETLERLKAMERYHVGAELAELDLKMRGPGEIYGTMQHGRRMLKVASFSDFELIKKTRLCAQKIFPSLDEYPLLKEKLKTLNLKQVSPD